MKSCIKIPRVFLPRLDFETWAAPAGDLDPYDREGWLRAVQRLGDVPSVLSCMLPDAFLRDAGDALFDAVSERIYLTLENGEIERLNRGMVYVERNTRFGVRKGLVASVDLEQFSPVFDKKSMICATTATLPALVKARCELRKRTVMEFPHAILLYRDKREKVLRALEEDLEELYDFKFPSGDGVKGYFLPEMEAGFAAMDLIARADPCFVVADGNHSFAAAKMHWDEVKATLDEEERQNHPARFFLAEFVNAYDESVVFEPVHRVVKETDLEAFCDYFQRGVKCKRESNVLYPVLSDADSYRRAEARIEEFLKEDFGKVEYRTGRPTELAQAGDCVVVALPKIETEELYSAVKGGKLYPAKSFCLSGGGARYCIEGRETSYD